MSIGKYGVWSNVDHGSLQSAVELALSAEQLGYEAWWTPEATGGREPFALLSHIAAKTARIAVGAGVALTYARDAVTARSAIMTLHESSGGRLIVGFGVGHRSAVTDLRGHRYSAPLAEMRRYLRDVRRAPYSPVAPFGEPPMLIGALGDGMLRLAAEDADGAFPLLMPALTIARVRGRLDRAAAGQGRPRPLLVVAIPVRISRDATAARTAVRRYLGRYLGLPNYVASLRRCGFEPTDLTNGGSDRLVDDLAAWGSEADVRRRLVEYHVAGADHVAIIPLDEAGNMADRPTLAAVAPPW